LPRLRRRNLAPVAVAGIVAFPIFFAAVLAVSLAIERPHRFQWRGRDGRLIEVDHPPTSGQEAKIWALALVLPVALVVVGLLASLWPRGGIYVVAAAGIALAVALPHRLDRWSAHHASRFPFGMDLIPDSNPSSTLGKGEWEQSAKETVLSLTHYAMGIAVAAAVVTTLLALRRRYSRQPAPVGPPPPAVTGEPEVSPVLGAVETESLRGASPGASPAAGADRG
jgi:hypothetical protein